MTSDGESIRAVSIWADGDDDQYRLDPHGELYETDDGELRAKLTQTALSGDDAPRRIDGKHIVVTTEADVHYHGTVDKTRRHLGHTTLHIDPMLFPTAMTP